MTPDELQARRWADGTCRRKVRYRHWWDAERTLRKVRAKGTDPDGTLVVYACRTCLGYHLGHPKKEFE